MAATSYAVVLSDIHIGNNAPTCWYQSAVHDEYLTAALRWIVGNERVRDVLFLGDVFDVWTYPPSVRPPTMREIIAANKKLLGPTGPFAELVRARPGHVSLMLGNHDGTLTHADIAQLNAALDGDARKGESIKLIDDSVIVLGTGGARTAFSHGHHWCMFNAPDDRSPWGGRLPVGHLVSRAIAYQWARLLKPGQTVADLPGMGNPNGIDLRALFGSLGNLLALLAKYSDDLTTPLVDYTCKVTGMPLTEQVILPSGHTTTPAAAKREFAHLFKHWATVKERRRDEALRAAMADGDGDYLAWFAQRVALQTSCDLVVLGHTHSAVRCLRTSPVNYVNSGYECVAKPDRATRQFTLTLVDLARASAQLFQVVPTGSGHAVTPATGRQLDSVIQKPAVADFSSYVRIRNRTGKPLTLVGTPQQVSSFWAVSPPKVIPKGGRADIWLLDLLGPAGSEGSFAYAEGAGAKPLVFRFACPTFDANFVSSPVDDYETKTADRKWQKGTPDRTGHPLQVRFTVKAPQRAAGNGGPPSTSGVSAVTQHPPDPRQRATAWRHADYLALARLILNRSKISAERGKVMCHAFMIADDLKPLIDIRTEPSTQRGRVRLVNPPNHLAGPDLYEVQLEPYGTFQYVLIKPNGAAPPPAIGGFLFLPSPDSPNLHLVTFNVAKLDVAWKSQCRNDHHAELQATRWIDEQPRQWRANLGCLTLTNSSRQRNLAYSPCNSCCQDLAHFLDILNSVPQRRAKAAAAMSWGDLYDKAAICGHPTSKSGIDMLVRSGWKLQGPVPRGVAPSVGMSIHPGDSRCLDPALSTR